MKRLTWLAVALVLALNVAGRTAEPALVELEALPDESPWIGQRLTFAVNVAVAGRFEGATVFDLPQVSGAILLKPETRAVVSSRVIDGQEYSVQRHEFALFCATEATVEVSGITVRCGSVAAFGEPKQSHRLSLPAFAVSPQEPPGFRPGELVVTTSDMTVRESWQPTPTGEAEVGDAFQRTITRRAEDVPGMLLPAIQQERLGQLAVYATDPVVSDELQRSEFRGERVETFTYICEASGQVEIPELRFRSWNPRTSDWDEHVLPSVSLTIAASEAPIAAADAVASAPGRTRWPWWVAAAVVVLITAVAGWRRRRPRVPDPEVVAYQAALAACRSHDPGRCYAAVQRWRAQLGSLDSGTETALLAAQEAIIGRRDRWRADDLAAAVMAWRRRHRRERRRRTATSRLPALNPTGAVAADGSAD